MLKKFSIIVLAALLMGSLAFSQQEYPPYYKVADIKGSVEEVGQKVKNLLTENGFEVLGSYNPGNDKSLGVIAYTRDDLKDILMKHEHRGGLAAGMRVGLIESGGVTTVSIVNPIYIFYAYLKEHTDNMPVAGRFSNDVKNTFRNLGSPLRGFGGNLDKKKLIKYRYMVGMQGYGNPAELAEFSSFRQGVSTIEENLKNQVGETVEVYKIVDYSNEVAIFGVGLLDKEKGESHFLPIIGEEHIAAMPYELILQGKNATMLHGRFRIALHWPELSMKTFTQIMSTPNDIEEFMKALCR